MIPAFLILILLTALVAVDAASAENDSNRQR